MIKIGSVEQFLAISKTDIIELSNDIDCSGIKIQCLIKDFRGTIEGHMHTISNIVVDDPIWGDEQRISLFRHLSHATIKDIAFENITFRLDKSIYKPCVAGLSCEVIDSVITNVKMMVTTTNGEQIPMIHESAGGILDTVSYTCNERDNNIFKYKEGSLYERNN